MDGKLLCCVLWLLANCVSISKQASISSTCMNSTEKAQCLTVHFKHSVFEGYDDTVGINSTEPNFLLTIFSNTPTTHLLDSYHVNIESSCAGTDSLSVQQLYSQSPQQCFVQMIACGSNVEMLLVADTEATQNNVFYTRIRLPLPSTDFQLSVLPKFEREETDLRKTIPAASNFAATDIDTAVSAGETADCNIAEPQVMQSKDPREILENGTVAAVCVFAILLILAAVASKLLQAIWNKINPPKQSGPGLIQNEMGLLEPKEDEVRQQGSTQAMEKDEKSPSGSAQAMEENKKSPSGSTQAMKETKKSPSGSTQAMKETKKSPSGSTQAMKETKKSPSGSTQAMKETKKSPSGSTQAMKETKKSPSGSTQAMKETKKSPSGSTQAMKDEKKPVGASEGETQGSFRQLVH